MRIPPERIRARDGSFPMHFTIQNIPGLKNRIRKTVANFVSLVMFFLVLPGATRWVRAQADPYSSMAPLQQYLMPKEAEIALARSAAPASVADSATVMVLGRRGYTVAVPGTNGFLCIVERSWSHTTNAPEFWNPKARSPNCFNAAAVGSIVKAYLMKTRLVLAGKSKTDVAQAIAMAVDRKELPAPKEGAMCFMMSKRQYLNDQVKNWHPHVMFFVASDAAESWGANLPGSPVTAFRDPQTRVTTYVVVVGHWSDGTPGPQ
jgi:hypothetical protein